jgi:polyvinyl alcohol dehydrogenase (cytochrome)
MVRKTLGYIVLVLIAPIGGPAERPDSAPVGLLSREAFAGSTIFHNRCAMCHENTQSGAPLLSVLIEMPRTAIEVALTKGRMREFGAFLSRQERRELVEYLTVYQPSPMSRTEHPLVMCKRGVSWFNVDRAGVGVGWGIDPENTRRISAPQAGLSSADIQHLRLKWAFEYPDVVDAVAQPLIAGSGLFVGSQDGTIYALDAAEGCIHWKFSASGAVRGGVVISVRGPDDSYAVTGPPTLFFGDRFANVYALDAASGSLRWRTKVEGHGAAGVTATPVLVHGRLYVPVSSLEEGPFDSRYPCCTFRGSIVALEASTGKSIWKRYTVASPALEQGRDASGTLRYGPSGAGVWSSPAVDRQRRLLYFTTGNSYSEPGNSDSNAIFAIDLETGEVRWRTQTIAEDNWNMGAMLTKRGADVDFSAPPVLVHGKDQKDIVVAGRKDGMTYGIDPDTGRILWNARAGTDPSPYAAMLFFGMMADGERIIVPSVGGTGPNPDTFTAMAGDGLRAFDAFTGEPIWTTRVSSHCGRAGGCVGLASAPIGFQGVVFAGSMDGYVRAFDTGSGEVLWTFDTAREFMTINGDTTKGGAVSRNGIMIANGMIYVNSGYSSVPGNVLLAFSVE